MTGKDPSPRKPAGLTLQESEERFRKIFTEGPLGMATVGADLGFLQVNETLARMLGYTVEELLGLSVKDVTLPERMDRDRASLQRLQQGELPVFRTEKQYVRKDGSLIWGALTVTLLRDDAGKVQSSLAMIENITSRKQEEEARIKSEALLCHAQRVARLGHYVFDITSGIFSTSAMLDEILGISAEYGKNVEGWLHLVHPEDRRQMQEYLADHVLGLRKPFDREYRICQADSGNTLWVHGLGELECDDQGQPTRLFGTIQDITEKKIAEEEQRKLEQRLNQIQRLESLGVLAGGIAHDFNNLLSGIFGYIDLARGYSTHPQVMEYLDATMKTMSRARALTQQLLTFAKGGAPVRKTEPVEAFLRETVRFALSGSNITSTFEIAPGLRCANFDRNLIAQVVDNLIINAQQAMPMGGHIRILADNVSFAQQQHLSLSAGDYIRIAIIDCGIGIPQEILPRIFDPFFTTKQKGSGLGLATCYSIIRRHDGAIEVESEPGRETTFRFFLPACDPPEKPRDVTDDQAFQHTGKILLMDDEEIVRQTISAMLTRLGYRCIATRNGQEALQAFVKSQEEGDPFRAIILDLTVPGGMGGQETALEIRARDVDIPIFVASGYAEDAVISNPRKFGFTDSISKPFDLPDLSTLLARNLSEETS